MLARSGIDVLVLAATEHQPPASAFPGVRVLHVPLEDSLTPSAQDRRHVRDVAAEVAAAVASEQRVLVTCWMGRNRSGWIVGHALVDLGYPVSRVLPLIRSKRPYAMGNRVFSADVLSRLDERYVRRSGV
jgi:protein-tyrosine phosphatase